MGQGPEHGGRRRVGIEDQNGRGFESNARTRPDAAIGRAKPQGREDAQHRQETPNPDRPGTERSGPRTAAASRTREASGILNIRNVNLFRSQELASGSRLIAGKIQRTRDEAHGSSEDRRTEGFPGRSTAGVPGRWDEAPVGRRSSLLRNSGLSATPGVGSVSRLRRSSLEGLADQEVPVIGTDPGHLPFLADRRADPARRAGGLSEFGDDREEGRLEIRWVGVEDDQPVQDLLPQRLTGQVGLLVAGPARGGVPLLASKIRAKSPGRREGSA